MLEPVATVVIPVHNNATTIAEQLDALARALQLAPPTEIMVVDNRSTDGSADVVRSWSESSGVPVRIVDAPDRAGEPYARNVGFRSALGRYVLYCDGDDVVSEGWISAMCAGLEAWPRTTGPVRTDLLNEAWAVGVRGTALFDGLQKLYDTIPYAHGCSMGFRREVLDELGGFDESFLAGCDQVIAIRAWQAGFDLGFIEDAVVHYRLRPDLRSMFRQGRSYGWYRVRVRSLTPELVDQEELRRATSRRFGWLVKHASYVVRGRDRRARWVWVASQMIGEAMGVWEVRRGR